MLGLELELELELEVERLGFDVGGLQARPGVTRAEAVSFLYELWIYPIPLRPLCRSSILRMMNAMMFDCDPDGVRFASRYCLDLRL
jgi:hypothetical protein